jgi:hypothetical protein
MFAYYLSQVLYGVILWQAKFASHPLGVVIRFEKTVDSAGLLSQDPRYRLVFKEQDLNIDKSWVMAKVIIGDGVEKITSSGCLADHLITLSRSSFSARALIPSSILRSMTKLSDSTVCQRIWLAVVGS